MNSEHGVSFELIINWHGGRQQTTRKRTDGHKARGSGNLDSNVRFTSSRIVGLDIFFVFHFVLCICYYYFVVFLVYISGGFFFFLLSYCSHLFSVDAYTFFFLHLFFCLSIFSFIWSACCISAIFYLLYDHTFCVSHFPLGLGFFSFFLLSDFFFYSFVGNIILRLFVVAAQQHLFWFLDVKTTKERRKKNTLRLYFPCALIHFRFRTFSPFLFVSLGFDVPKRGLGGLGLSVDISINMAFASGELVWRCLGHKVRQKVLEGVRRLSLPSLMWVFFVFITCICFFCLLTFLVLISWVVFRLYCVFVAVTFIYQISR